MSVVKHSNNENELLMASLSSILAEMADADGRSKLKDVQVTTNWQNILKEIFDKLVNENDKWRDLIKQQDNNSSSEELVEAHCGMMRHPDVVFNNMMQNLDKSELPNVYKFMERYSKEYRKFWREQNNQRRSIWRRFKSFCTRTRINISDIIFPTRYRITYKN